MTPFERLPTDASLMGIVRAVAFESGAVVVRESCPALDAPLATAAREVPDERDDVVTLVRAMYRSCGLDPTKTRPSSEALLRRVRRGESLPRVNSLVDVINWSSLESRLPFGLYDADRIEGGAVVRMGREAESYAGIRKDVVHLTGRMVVADDRGAFGNPTSDSARTMVTRDTTRALVVVFAPAALAPSWCEDLIGRTQERIVRYCADPHPVQSFG